MPARPSSPPFPFLPVVLTSPPAARTRASSSSDATVRTNRPPTTRSPKAEAADASRAVANARPRTSPRAGVALAPPAPGIDGGVRVEIVRRIARDEVTLLGAIVR
ncbi:hypothetical protein [Pandoraea sp. CB10b_02]|uniref:hypothetical protein n=1 Tax=Pandoraea sp. CB10b_02 TaxID=2014535 RepID=UPI00257C0365|nr:hypothetical protein [Pandoraea sp. CB10b_02]